MNSAEPRGRLAGRVAVVTGAGSGIGYATALRFAQEGACIAAVDLDPAAAEATATAIVAGGGQALAVRADVSVAADVEAAFEEVHRRWGRLDVLHNNAGITPSPSPLHRLDEAEWDRVLSTNLKSVWLCCKYAVPHFIATGGGAILNTASMAALRARPYRVHYEASKGGVLSLTRALAIELAPYHVRANCICPGPVDTPARTASLGRSESAAARARALEQAPIPRPARVEEIANAALFLVSDEASYVNGHALVIDGGESSGNTAGLYPIP